LPGLAFLGSEISTFNNILTHGLQAAWLSKVLAGELALPPIAQMQTVVEVEMNWKRTWSKRAGGAPMWRVGGAHA
jgi:dimethylaniline monooxygenase (N-oxide forming)